MPLSDARPTATRSSEPRFPKGVPNMLAFLDRPDIAGGEALGGLLRPGNAGSNTAADHIQVLDMALASLPAHVADRASGYP
jgi:hypothetical protein